MTPPILPHNFSEMGLEEFTVIARVNPSIHGPRWLAVEGAPLSLREANRLWFAGLLIKANRYGALGCEVVFKYSNLARDGFVSKKPRLPLREARFRA